jgi:D-aminopeptidase
MNAASNRSPATPGRARARDLGIRIGRLAPGPWNAITDVPGIRVGHTTLISGDGPLVVGTGPVRTGVTVILPREGNIATEPVFAGFHVLNGNGEMTGLLWIEESGLLTTPVAITNTHSVGVVRDAIIGYGVTRGIEGPRFSLPVVAETYDGLLSDINGMHVRSEHVFAALDGAASGPVREGCVGGGTGMICHGFKGGIGTASRALAAEEGGWIVGVLVQANYGSRALLRVDGVPVGREIPESEVPSPWAVPPSPPARGGSIIIVVATNAPLLPTQCRRLAQRATIGLARIGGIGANSSGDIFLAFSTGNRSLEAALGSGMTRSVQMLPNEAMTSLFEAVAEATEEAIVNALCTATTMTGAGGRVAHAIPLDRLRDVMRYYRRVQQ